jgi:hypothetical protein
MCKIVEKMWEGRELEIKEGGGSERSRVHITFTGDKCPGRASRWKTAAQSYLFQNSVTIPRNEYHSVRSLAQELDVSLSTVYARLTDVLGFSLPHTRWISHSLTDELKATRVAASMKTFEILEQYELTYFAGIIRGDESWLFSSSLEIVYGD